jgi:hypothetical protein
MVDLGVAIGLGVPVLVGGGVTDAVGVAVEETGAGLPWHPINDQTDNRVKNMDQERQNGVDERVIRAFLTACLTHVEHA